MEKIFISILMFFLFVASSCQSCSSENGNDGKAEEVKGPLPLADPYILLHGNTYYAYGTHSDEGIEVYTSSDLLTWTFQGLALHKNDTWADRWFWAPEVYHINNKFYMFFSADEHIGVATADSPQGPFRQQVKQPVWEEKSIDTSLFIDDDGTPYLFFVRFTDGNVIWVAEMNPDLMTIKPETLKECIKVEEDWELAQDVPARVAEGPSVLKKDGVYYLIYSANHYQSKEYGVGYATADNPAGPWKKYEGNPVLVRANGLVGTGHGAPFGDTDGNWKYIFHAHWDNMNIQPRVSYIKDFTISGEGVLLFGESIIKPQVVNNPQ